MTAQPQHMTALASANRIRYGIAAVKREVAAGTLTVIAALDDERAGRLKIGDLLSAQHRWGTERTHKVLTKVGINEQRRVQDLTRRQRQALVDHFDPPPPAPEPVAPPPPPAGMEPERVDARVAAALLKAPATRVELELRMREMLLAFDDLDAALARLLARGAVVVLRGNGFELYSVDDARRAA